MSIVIHHNPDCGTSRNVLAIIKASGETPLIIEYLQTGWTRPQLLGLFAAASIALDPPKAVDPADRQELYNTATKRAPDGLADLPNSYLNWQMAGDTPKLGAPMAGDLGGTMVSEEEEWGLEPCLLYTSPSPRD